MKIEILRSYGVTGANGTLSIDGVEICSTIELPWKENATGVSCVPEGKYEVKRRYSEKHGKHLILLNVPGRELILFHPANNALQELRGCIAPVSKTAGFGRGILSRAAFRKLIDLTYQAFDNNDSVFLTIKS